MLFYLNPPCADFFMLVIYLNNTDIFKIKNVKSLLNIYLAKMLYISNINIKKIIFNSKNTSF